MARESVAEIIPGGTLGTITYPPEVDFVASHGQGALL